MAKRRIIGLTEQAVFNSGKSAYREGKGIKDCPLKDELAYIWIQGWTEAKAEGK